MTSLFLFLRYHLEVGRWGGGGGGGGYRQSAFFVIRTKIHRCGDHGYSNVMGVYFYFYVT